MIVLGTATFILMLSLHPESLTPVPPLLLLVVLSSLTSAFKVQFPIASGSNMSVSYVVDIASLILRGPHATMIVGAAGGWSQSTLNSRSRNPVYRTLFNMACLVITVQAAGQLYQRLGGRPSADLSTIEVLIPLTGMALAYFIFNTVPIAMAIALTTSQNAWHVWKTDFAPNVGSYVLGVAAAFAVIAVTESAGYWLTLLFAAAPLYLTYKLYRAGAESEARQGAILEAANDAIVTTDHNLAIREFNPAAERMFGHRRTNILGRNVDMLLPPADRATEPVLQVGQNRHLGHRGGGPVAAHGPLQRPEQRAERRELGLAQRLAAKHQHAVAHVEVAQLGDRRIVLALPQAQADDFAGQGRVQRTGLEHCGVLGASFEASLREAPQDEGCSLGHYRSTSS